MLTLYIEYWMHFVLPSTCVFCGLRSSRHLFPLQSDATGLKVDCIVVDAITPLLGPLLSAVSAQGHAIMDGMMRELRALAQRHSLPVLVN